MNNAYYKHKVTNQIIVVENGFNWKVFLFGPLYLFYKNDYNLGFAILVFNLICAYTIVYFKFPIACIFPIAIITWQASVWNEEYKELLVKRDYVEFTP